MARTYPGLGAVKPHVRQCALDLGNKHDVSTIYGIGSRTGVSDHPFGLALDFMVYDDKAKGDAIVADLKSGWQKYGVKYIIWQQAIDEGDGFKPMEDRGGKTANHRDHPHASFESSPDAAGSYSGGTDNASSSSSLDAAFSGEFWSRILMFLIGAGLLGFVVWELMK